MPTKDALFRASKAETKADATTRAAKEIIDAQTCAREAQIKRLRATRLERDAAEKAQETDAPQKKSRKTARVRKATRG